MADATMTILSERYAVAVLRGAFNDMTAANQTLTFGLPAGFGDCTLLDLVIDCFNITTMMTNPELRGPLAVITSPDITAREDVGQARWTIQNAAELMAWIDPNAPGRRWAAEELLNIQFQRVDTGSTTADLVIRARVVRNRNQGSATPVFDPAVAISSTR